MDMIRGLGEQLKRSECLTGPSDWRSDAGQIIRLRSEAAHAHACTGNLIFATAGLDGETGVVLKPAQQARMQKQRRPSIPAQNIKHQGFGTDFHASDCAFAVLLSRRHAITMIDPSLRVRRAIHASDPLLVSRILHSHPHLLHNPDSSPTGLSNTNLHLAASLGLVPIIKVLLSLHHERDGISLNEDHQTPLMLASRAGHTDAVHLLCTACPQSIPKRDIRGRDAIIFASEGGHDTCLQILLTFAPGGPEECLGNKDLDGNTALHFASSNGHLLVLRTLLAAGADSEVRNVWSWTPVAYSATVQAEVYFKGLVGEVERRRAARKLAEERGTGGGVRLVGEGED